VNLENSLVLKGSRVEARVESLGDKKESLGLHSQRENQVRGAIHTCFNVASTVLHDFHGRSA